MPSFALTRLETGPVELAELLPLRASVIRVMPGSDRPDYLLCAAERAIPFRPPSDFDVTRAHPSFRTTDDRGELISVEGLVICTRIVGDRFQVGMKDLVVNIAYVIDNSLSVDSEMDFSKLEFAAIGFIDDVPEA